MESQYCLLDTILQRFYKSLPFQDFHNLPSLGSGICTLFISGLFNHPSRFWFWTLRITLTPWSSYIQRFRSETQIILDNLKYVIYYVSYVVYNDCMLSGCFSLVLGLSGRPEPILTIFRHRTKTHYKGLTHTLTDGLFKELLLLWRLGTFKRDYVLNNLSVGHFLLISYNIDSGHPLLPRQ